MAAQVSSISKVIKAVFVDHSPMRLLTRNFIYAKDKALYLIMTGACALEMYQKSPFAGKYILSGFHSKTNTRIFQHTRY